MTVYAGEDVERGKHSTTTDVSAILYSHFGDQYGGSRGGTVIGEGVRRKKREERRGEENMGGAKRI